MEDPEEDELPDGESKQDASLSDLVKEMVKEMDGDEFYTKPDLFDESQEEYWFNVEITLERGGCSVGEGEGGVVRAASLRKPWSEFLRLHNLLLTDEFGCDEVVKERLPPLPAGPGKSASGGVGDVCGDGSNESDFTGLSSADIARGLDAYLKALLAVPAVVQSQVFSGFLENSRRHRRRWALREEENGKEQEDDRRRVGSAVAGWRYGFYGWGGRAEARGKSPQTAIDFLLQPFEYSKVYLPRRAEHTESIDVLGGENVVWKFEILDHLDIDFSVTFRPQPVAVSSSSHPTVETAAGDGDGFAAAVATGGGGGGGGGDDEFAYTGRLLSSPGPKGDGGDAALSMTAINDSNSSSEVAQGRRSGWWGRGGGGVGCKAPAGARRHDTCGGDGGAKEEMVHLPTRYSTGGGDPVQGSYTCPAAGTCILRWDNSFSRLRGKRLCYVFESATIQTMRAAIEAAGATDQKRRATRSTAAQKILDSGHGEVKVSVTAVGFTDDFDRAGKGQAENGGDGDGSISGIPDSANCLGGIYYGSHERFGRVRRMVADLLRELGGIVDARRLDEVRSGASKSLADNSYGKVDAEGVERLMKQFEILEDEIASVSARRAQSEAQAKVLLANLQKANTRADRLERSLEDVREDLSAVRASLGEVEASRDEAAAAAAAAGARLQTSEEQLLRSRREHDLLQAERSVWQVARSGIQEELAKVVAELELERHHHDDTSRALAKSHESRAHAEAEVARLSRRLEEERGGAGGARAALASEREAARLAREEAEDARAAVAELDAAVAELGAQKRVLVAGLRSRERALSDRCAAAEARAEEAAMMRRKAEARVRELEEDAERREAAQADGEVRLQRLRAEKRILLAEIRKGTGSAGAGAGSGVGSGVAAAAAAAGGDLAVSPRGGTRQRADDGAARGVGGDGGVEGARGREGGGDSSSGSSRRGSFSPRSSGESGQENKARLKQLSRQLVLLRERQLHLKEDIRADPANASALRLEADVDRAVQNLELRIRRVLSVVAGGGDEDDSSVDSSPPARSFRKGADDLSTARDRGALITATIPVDAVGEVETHFV